MTPLPGKIGHPAGGLTRGPDGSTFQGYCSTGKGGGCLYALLADLTFQKIAAVKWPPGGSPTSTADGVVGAAPQGGKNGVGSLFRISGS